MCLNLIYCCFPNSSDLHNSNLALKSLGTYQKLRASHTAKTQESQTNYTHIFIFVRSVHYMCNWSVDGTWTIIDCKWMCVEGGLCMILSFEW